MVTKQCGWVVACAALALAGCAREEPSLNGEMAFQDGRWVPVAAAADDAAENDLVLIRWYFNHGRHRKAIKFAKKFLKKYVDDPRGEEVMMIAATAEIRRERYYQAYEWLEKLLDLHPIGRYFERALVREVQVAEAFLAGKKRVVWGFIYLSAREEALEILLRIAEHAPGSAIAEEAMLRIPDYRYSSRQYGEAVEAYDQYLELFPKAEGAPHAMLHAARAYSMTFKGVAYDAGPLIEADLRYRTLIAAFPATAARHDVRAAIGQIAVKLANKDYVTARLYERTHRPDAAAFYYRQVTSRYPQTAWAARARNELQRLDKAIAGQPREEP